MVERPIFQLEPAAADPDLRSFFHHRDQLLEGVLGDFEELIRTLVDADLERLKPGSFESESSPAAL